MLKLLSVIKEFKFYYLTMLGITFALTAVAWLVGFISTQQPVMFLVFVLGVFAIVSGLTGTYDIIRTLQNKEKMERYRKQYQAHSELRKR